MSRPVVGIIGNSNLIDGEYPVHAAGKMNVDAVGGVCGAIPLIIPTDPEFIHTAELMEICDGFLFTGGRPNVHPEEYGEAETEAHGAFDRDRDAVALPLIRACVEAGQPIIGICRGFQEVAVAMEQSYNPKLLLQIDEGKVAENYDICIRHLNGLNKGYKLRGVLLGLSTTILFSLLAVAALVLAVLVWRGFV